MLLLKLFVVSIVLCIVPLIVFSIDAVVKKPKKIRKTVSDKHFTVRPPMWLLYVGVISWLSDTFVGYLYLTDILIYDKPLTSEVLWANIFILAVIVLYFYMGLYLIAVRLSNKVVFYCDTITVYRPLKKTFSFTFADIALVNVKKKQYYYHCQETLTITTKNGKSFTVDTIEEQAHRFYKLLKAQVSPELLSECEVRRYFDMRESIQKYAPGIIKKIVRPHKKSQRSKKTKLVSAITGIALIVIVWLRDSGGKSVFVMIGIIVVCICVYLLNSKE